MTLTYIYVNSIKFSEKFSITWLFTFDFKVERGYKFSSFHIFLSIITDIDDKIISRANENEEDFSALTERFIDEMHADERALNVLPPDLEPHATRSMDKIILMIMSLFEKGLLLETHSVQNKTALRAPWNGLKLDQKP